jgi:hypothetical protein
VAQDEWGHPKCVEQVIELGREQRLGTGQWHQSNRRFHDEGQGAFRADDDAREVDRLSRIDKGVEIVAADAAEQLGKALLDFGGMRLCECGYGAIGAGLDAVTLLHP